MPVVKGELRSLEACISCHVAGTLYFKVETEMQSVRDELLPVGTVWRYFGTLVIRGCRFNRGEVVRLTTDNGFVGNVLIRNLEVTDEGRSFVAKVESHGKPESQPSE